MPIFVAVDRDDIALFRIEARNIHEARIEATRIEAKRIIGDRKAVAVRPIKTRKDGRRKRP
jgi:hypothetical protein